MLTELQQIPTLPKYDFALDAKFVSGHNRHIMTEISSNNPEQSEGREYIAEQLAGLNELLREMYEVAMGDNPHAVSDVSLDVLRNLCVAMARHDSELGQTLVGKLEERATAREAVAPEETQQHLDLSKAVRQELGMPPTTWWWSIDMSIGQGPEQDKQAPPTV